MRNRASRAAARPGDEDDVEEERPRTRGSGGGARGARNNKRDAAPSASAPLLLNDPPCPTCLDGAFPAQTAASRCKPGVGWAVLFLMLVLAPITEHGWRVVPGWVAASLATAAGLELARRILAFRRWGDEYPHVGRFCLWFCLMIAELLFENFMVYFVSATDLRKYEDVPALQDNLALLLDAAKTRRPLFWKPLLEFRWAGTVHFLCAALFLAFSVAWDQVPFSGFGMMSRFFATMVVGRLVRVAAFCATVLPNPRPGCYARRFPPPPADAWGVLREGFQQLRGMGGCNDLVVSGHGAFWTTAPLMFRSYYGFGGFSGGGGGLAGAGGTSGGGGGGATATRKTATKNTMGLAVQVVLWVCLLQTAVRDAMEAFHYSVDMLLAVVVTCAAWSWTRSVYPPSASVLRERAVGSPPDAFRWVVLMPIVVALFAGAVIIFIGNA
jgi:DNA mismatch repair protein MutS2